MHLRLKKNDTAVRMKLTPEVQEAAEGEKRGRKASKETRRQQLIEATIDSLAKRGYSETTLADVADGPAFRAASSTSISRARKSC